MAHDGDLGPISHQKSSSFSSHGSRKRAAPLFADGAAQPLPEAPRAATEPRTPENGYQRLVFTDPVAFRYLEEDPSTAVVERRRTLTGYQTYIVEQWACSRVHPTFVINTYTGDAFHSVIVGVLSVPTDEHNWSPRLKVYFNAMSQFHARKRQTDLGIIMVTNLSSFPSSLTVIVVPDGDVKNHRKDFIVNEDLKRLGCAGRAGLNIKPPSPATEAKFYQLYRASERVPLYDAVMELIRLCQLALTVFGKLPSEYVDGLLCDITERAINDWWTDIGTDLYNIEPNDGILGPTTVSALLGTLMGARNRLYTFGAPVPKDSFHINAFKRGISSFQKSQKLNRTRRLDRQTLDRLHRVTAKAASSDGWTVPRAVKSTVAELGGRGGEMVMGIVGARDKAGISQVETLDIDRFVQLLNGERAKWLWLGKEPKSGGGSFHQSTGDESLVFIKDDQGGYVWTSRRRDSPLGYISGRPSIETELSRKQGESPGISEEKDSQTKSTPRKSVTTKVSDARAGFGRIRDAVGIPNLRPHHRRASKDSVDLSISRQATSGVVTQTPSKDEHRLNEVSEKQLNFQDSFKPTRPRSSFEIDSSEKGKVDEIPEQPPSETRRKPQPNDARDPARPESPEDSPPAPVPGATPTLVKRLLRQPRSSPYVRADDTVLDQKEAYWPRHLSFSAVEDAVLLNDDTPYFRAPTATANMKAAEAILVEDLAASDARHIGEKIDTLADPTASWIERQVSSVESIEESADAQLQELNAIYQDKLEEYNTIRMESAEVTKRESANLTERTRKVELLGAKLDYELDALESRIEEVEEGLGEYERNIIMLERRVRNLVQVDEQKSETSWFRWGVQLFNRRPQRP